MEKSREKSRVIVYGKLKGTLIKAGEEQSEVKLDPTFGNSGWYQHFSNKDIKILVERIRNVGVVER